MVKWTCLNATLKYIASIVTDWQICTCSKLKYLRITSIITENTFIRNVQRRKRNWIRTATFVSFQTCTGKALISVHVNEMSKVRGKTATLIFAAKWKNKGVHEMLNVFLTVFTTLPASGVERKKRKSSVMSPQRLHHAKTCLAFPYLCIWGSLLLPLHSRRCRQTNYRRGRRITMTILQILHIFR